MKCLNWFSNSNVEKIGAYLALCQLTLCQWTIRQLKNTLFRERNPIDTAKIKHIAIYRIGNIGDIAVTIPALHRIRQMFPNALISFITSTGRPDLVGAEEVLSAFPELVDTIIPYQPSQAKTLKELYPLKAIINQTGPVDLWIDLPITLQTFQRSLQELLFAKFIKSHWAIGFNMMLPGHFQSAYARYYPKRLIRTSDWLLSILEEEKISPHNVGADCCPPAHKQTGGQQSTPTVKTFICGQSETQLMTTSSSLFSKLGINPDIPILAVNAGAKLAIKQWPKEHYAETISRILQSEKPIQVVFLGSLPEKALNTSIIEMIRTRVSSDPCKPLLNLCGQLTLPETIDFLQYVTVLLTNDTGPMHLAGLLQKPTVVPMSGQFPAPIWHPPQDNYITIVSQPVSCAPCFKDHCPIANQPCMTEIPVSTVVEALMNYLY